MSEIIKLRCKALRSLRLLGALVVATSIGFVISASAAGAGDASGYVRRASCTLVRYYVARYTAPAAEACARDRRRNSDRPAAAIDLRKPRLSATCRVSQCKIRYGSSSR